MKSAMITAAIASLFFVSRKPAKTEDTQTAAPVESSIPYPLATCPVSGEKLGEMGKPYVFVHDGREIKLCCKNCLKDFNKDPAKFNAVIVALSLNLASSLL